MTRRLRDRSLPTVIHPTAGKGLLQSCNLGVAASAVSGFGTSGGGGEGGVSCGGGTAIQLQAGVAGGSATGIGGGVHKSAATAGVIDVAGGTIGVGGAASVPTTSTCTTGVAIVADSLVGSEPEGTVAACGGLCAGILSATAGAALLPSVGFTGGGGSISISISI